MREPFISIIIPTLNSGKTLAAALDSIQRQTFADWEVRIMDGASTDDTLAVAGQFRDPRFLVHSEPDSGVYDAMNHGIAVARGRFLFFLGSDDTLTNSNVLQEVYDGIRAHPGHALYYGNIYIHQGAAWSESQTVYDGPFSLGKILEKNLPHQATFYHRSIFRRFGNYNLRYAICADYDLNLRVFPKVSSRYLDLTVSDFSAGGLSSREVDHQFWTDFKQIIVENFYPHLHTDRFREFEHHILREARRQLRQRRLRRSMHLYWIGYRFKIQRQFNKS